MTIIRRPRAFRKACAGILGMAIAVSTAAHAYAQSSASVLCYHAFLEKKRDNFCFTLDELNAHIAQLRKEGFRFVSIKDIIGGKTEGTKNLLVTVDDGNKSVYEAYKKVFKPNGIRPLLGIYPNIIGKMNYALTWEQLIELANDGCDIAAHGYYHLKINQRLLDEHPAHFRKEIFGSKKVLEEKLGRKIAVFVYPFGLRTEAGARALKEAGYQYAFTINRGKIDMPLVHTDANLQLPRYMVTRTGWKSCLHSVVRNSKPKPVKIARAELETKDNEKDPATPPVQVAATDKKDSKQVSARNPHVEAPLRFARPVAEYEDENELPVSHRPLLRPGASAIDLVSYERPRTGNDPTSSLNRAVARTGERKTVPIESSLFDFRSMQPDPTARQISAGVVLEAKAGKDVKGYRADVKKNYYKLTGDSYKIYNRFLGLVKGKIDRIRRQVKQYVVSHL